MAGEQRLRLAWACRPWVRTMRYPRTSSNTLLQLASPSLTLPTRRRRMRTMSATPAASARTRRAAGRGRARGTAGAPGWPACATPSRRYRPGTCASSWGSRCVQVLATHVQMLRGHWQWASEAYLPASARLLYRTQLCKPASRTRTRTPDRLLLPFTSLVYGRLTHLLGEHCILVLQLHRQCPLPPLASPPPSQHYLTMLGSTVVIPALLVPAMGGTAEGGSTGACGAA